jgi:DedD protein
VAEAPAPKQPAPTPVTAPAVAAVKAPAAHTPSSTLDKGEEFVEVPKAPKAADTHIAKAPEHKPEPKKPEPKSEAKPEPKQEKPEHKPEARPEPKKPEPAKAASPNDEARAMAILEGKPAESASKYVIQVDAFATQDKVDEVQGKLKSAGIKSYVQKVSTASGERTRVRLGPFSSKEEADKARAKLGKIGLDGSVIPA